MDQMITKYGVPTYVRWNKGPEFIGRSLGGGSRNRISKRCMSIQAVHGRTGMWKFSMTSSGENAWGVKYSTLSPNAGWSWMIGNGSMTRSNHIEVFQHRPHLSLQEPRLKEPKFFLRCGLRPPLQKILLHRPRLILSKHYPIQLGPESRRPAS